MRSREMFKTDISKMYCSMESILPGGNPWKLWVNMFVHKHEEKGCIFGPKRGALVP